MRKILLISLLSLGLVSTGYSQSVTSDEGWEQLGVDGKISVYGHTPTLDKVRHRGWVKHHFQSRFTPEPLLSLEEADCNEGKIRTIYAPGEPEDEYPSKWEYVPPIPIRQVELNWLCQ